MRTFFLLPRFSVSGGNLKLLDYATHVAELDNSKVEIVQVGGSNHDEYFTELAQVEELNSLKNANFIFDGRFSVAPGDKVVFSSLAEFGSVLSRVPGERLVRQGVFFVQGFRVANPLFEGGIGLSLLNSELPKVIITEELADSLHRQVTGTNFFTSRMGLRGLENTIFNAAPKIHRHREPLRIAYTSWKSDFGLNVEMLLRTEVEFEFRSINSKVHPSEVQELMEWADVFIADPLEEEGFYLPGLEAMGNGCVLITPDVVGNRAYCDFRQNCVQVDFGNARQVVEAIRGLRESPRRFSSILEKALATASQYLYQDERRVTQEIFRKICDFSD